MAIHPRLARITAVAAAGLLAATVSGCSAASDSASDNTIEVWSRSSEEPAKNYREIFAAFEAETGIKVDYKPNPELATALQTAVTAQDLPDVVINDAASMGSYQTQGLLTAVDRASIDPDATVSDEDWKIATGRDGKIYGVPYSRHAMAYAVRTDWLDKLDLEVPKTRAEFVKVAQAFAQDDPDGNGKDDTYGWAASGTAKSGYAAYWASPLLWSEGGDFVTDQGDGTWKSAIASEKSVAGVKAALDVVCHDPRIVQPSAVTDDTTAVSNLALDGSVGIFPVGPWQIPGISAAIGADNWAAISPPAGSDGTADLAEGENVYLMAGSKATEAQQKLATFMIGKEAQTIGMTGAGSASVRLPVNTALSASKSRPADAKSWKVIEDVYADSARFYPAAIDFAPIRAAAGTAFNDLFTNCDTAAVPTRLAELDGELSTILQQQNSGK